MRGLVSKLKNGRVALAAIALATGVAGMTLGTGAAHADWNDHRGRVVERHWDRGDHWRHDRWERERWHGGYGYRVYAPYPTYYAPPRVYYPPPYYYGAEPGVSLGFTFR